VQLVLRYTKGGGSSTESLISHLKSKHIIHVIHESEDHKTIPAVEEIRSQIVIKETSLFEATTKRSNNLEKPYHALVTMKPTSVEPEWAFLATGLFANSETDFMMKMCFDCHASVLQASLKNCAYLN